jgi:hypothetical protein
MTHLRRIVGVKIGAAVAAICGLDFIHGAAEGLPGGMQAALRGLGVVACIGVVALTMLRRGGNLRSGPSLGVRTWLVYWAMVVFELLVLRVGSSALIQADHAELCIALSALIVGAHFLPFAKAFGFSDFKPLAWALIALGLIGGGLSLVVGSGAGVVVAGVAGVLSGVVMFAFSLRLGRTIATVRPREPSLA